MMKEKRGITLIALVVTIVVLLILAGVSISMLGGKNGIIKQAQDAKEETIKAKEKETISLAKTAIISRGEKVEQENLQEEIDLIEGQGKVNVILGEDLVSVEIYFTDTKNTYTEEIYVAQEEEISDEEASYWTYKENGDGTITLLKYNPPVEKLAGLTQLTIPNQLFGLKVKQVGVGIIMSGVTQSIWGDVTGDRVWFACGSVVVQSTIKSIWIQDGIEIIGKGAFSYGEQIEEIKIPSSVIAIGARAFYKCSGLKSIIIPDGVTSIEYGTFGHCTVLTNITIPNSITSIGDGAFGDCTGLTNIDIPNSVTIIDNSAFDGCSNLENIKMSNNLNSVGVGILNGTLWLSNQPEGLVYIGNACLGYKGTMPEGAELELRPGTVVLADNAFYNRETLTSLTIPKSLMRIGKDVFVNCHGLKTINYEGTQEEWNQIAIDNSDTYLIRAAKNYNYTKE